MVNPDEQALSKMHIQPHLRNPLALVAEVEEPRRRERGGGAEKGSHSLENIWCQIAL